VIEDVERHDEALWLRGGGDEARVVVDAEIMLEPHYRSRGGIGGGDPATAAAPVAARGRVEGPESERDESHGISSAAASAAAVIGGRGDKKGWARARPWQSCGGGRLLGPL
jgi:hypothetical protein